VADRSQACRLLAATSGASLTSRAAIYGSGDQDTSRSVVIVALALLGLDAHGIDKVDGAIPGQDVVTRSTGRASPKRRPAGPLHPPGGLPVGRDGLGDATLKVGGDDQQPLLDEVEDGGGDEAAGVSRRGSPRLAGG